MGSVDGQGTSKLQLVIFYGPPLSAHLLSFFFSFFLVQKNTPDSRMLLLCSVKGKTQYYEERFKGTHVRVSAEETFRAQPHVSLHRVVNVVLSHIQGGKSVVIGTLEHVGRGDLLHSYDC